MLSLDNAVSACYSSITLLTRQLNEKGNAVKMINPETKTYKVFQALRSGESITESRARKMGVGNLRAEVSRIRNHGFCVYANSRKAGNGVTVTEYQMGKPSRKLIAAGYKALAAGLV